MGPRAFESEERQYFFGRDEEIEILQSMIMARRTVLFFAQSGAGKSSLLRAGLIPELTKQEKVGRGRRARLVQKMRVLPIASVGSGIPSQLESSIDNIFVFSALFSINPEVDPNSLANQTLTQGLEPIINLPNDAGDEEDNAQCMYMYKHCPFQQAHSWLCTVHAIVVSAQTESQ
ncbi:MAG: hypothetical protein AAF629_27390 [Chloroflexota bacterium]